MSAPPAPANDECAPIVRNRFDDPDEWKLYIEPGADATLEADAVWMSASPTGEQVGSYAELRSVAEAELTDGQLGAAVSIAGEGIVAGIGWNRDPGPGLDDDDYFVLLVDGIYLEAVRKPAFGEAVSLCGTDCPVYDPGLHAHLGLRAVAGEVVYQFSGDGRGWSDLARAPIADGVYSAVASVYADAPGATDLEVSAMTWTDCEP